MGLNDRSKSGGGKGCDGEQSPSIGVCDVLASEPV